jgi:hypothetical protein
MGSRVGVWIDARDKSPASYSAARRVEWAQAEPLIPPARRGEVLEMITAFSLVGNDARGKMPRGKYRGEIPGEIPEDNRQRESARG